MVNKQKKQKRDDDERINRIYRERCNGVQIGVMQIGTVFNVGKSAIQDGLDDQGIGDRIVAYVDTIRHN